jgi:hypothetical protein
MQRGIAYKNLQECGSFRFVGPCSLVGLYRRFKGACSLHHQDDGGDSRYIWNVYPFILATLRNLNLKETCRFVLSAVYGDHSGDASYFKAKGISFGLYVDFSTLENKK